jgi:glyoxylase-like metal-dependent hydrolase (beta-lactamase superfamily II)
MSPIALHAGNPGPMTGAGNWTWLIPGRVPTLIDAGVGMPAHLDAVESALDGAPLAQVLVTHGHSDHASGASAIASRRPEARFLKLPWPGRDERWPVSWVPLADGEVIAVGDTFVTAVHTPGHAPDHLCFWHEATRTLFGGDLAIAGTTVFIPASHDGDLQAYLVSLERVLALDPARIVPAHGPVIEDPATVLRNYLVHRQRREEQILAALRSGDTRPGEVVARVYSKLRDELHARAIETVVAHLKKLEREGVVAHVGEAWSIMKP